MDWRKLWICSFWENAYETLKPTWDESLLQLILWNWTAVQNKMQNIEDTQQEVYMFFILFCNVNCIFHWTVYWQYVFHLITLSEKYRNIHTSQTTYRQKILLVWVRNQFIHFLDLFFFKVKTPVTHFWMNYILAKRIIDVLNTVSIYIFTFTLMWLWYLSYLWAAWFRYCKPVQSFMWAELPHWESEKPG